MSSPDPVWHFGLLSAPCFMGVLNITPDSFSDGGQFRDSTDAAARARQLVREGARIIDVGAEASSFFRKGIGPVEPAEQLRRLVPVIELLRDLPTGVAISIDTRSAAVAGGILASRPQNDARGWIINDISAGVHDPGMLPLIAAQGVAVILMHMSACYPATPAGDDPDIVQTVRADLAERFAAAVAAGIAPERIALDPGIGFGKTMRDNWRLAADARGILPAEIQERGVVVVGASRKRFLETEPPADVRLPAWWGPLVKRLDGMAEAVHQRDGKSAALGALTCWCAGVVHRVHNVKLADKAFAFTMLD